MREGLQRCVQLIIDAVFPPRLHARVLRPLKTEDARTWYHPRVVGAVTALATFNEPRVRAAIHEAKYYGNAHAQTLLGNLLEEHLSRHPRAREALWIPVPLSPARLRARGYNQAERILTHCPSPLSVAPDILVRTRNTTPQTSLSRAARTENMRDAFLVSDPARITGSTIILFDDVVTTGATLDAALRALAAHHPASITCIALAH